MIFHDFLKLSADQQKVLFACFYFSFLPYTRKLPLMIDLIQWFENGLVTPSLSDDQTKIYIDGLHNTQLRNLIDGQIQSQSCRLPLRRCIQKWFNVMLTTEQE